MLKQAASMMRDVDRVFQASSYRAALTRIDRVGGSFDLILTASELDPVEGEEFIAKALEAKASCDAAFIVILEKNDQTVGNVAQNLLSGANGILMSPFSVDDLLEVFELARVVKKQRSGDRHRRALRLVIEGIIKRLDIIWYNWANDIPMGFALRDLREAASVLPGLTQEELEIFFELAIELYGDLPAPPVIEKKPCAYQGASARVKKKMESQKKASLSFEPENNAQGEEPS